MLAEIKLMFCPYNVSTYWKRYSSACICGPYVGCQESTSASKTGLKGEQIDNSKDDQDFTLLNMQALIRRTPSTKMLCGSIWILTNWLWVSLEGTRKATIFSWNEHNSLLSGRSDSSLSKTFFYRRRP